MSLFRGFLQSKESEKALSSERIRMLGRLENDHALAHIGAPGDILLWRLNGRAEGRAQ
jgi:hypothetical protein